MTDWGTDDTVGGKEENMMCISAHETFDILFKNM